MVTITAGHDEGNLGPGDTFAFDGDQARSYANMSDLTSKFTLAVFEPGVGKPRPHPSHLNTRTPDGKNTMTIQSDSLRAAQIDGRIFALRPDYRGFGAKPQRTRSSLEALLRRAEDGLPRVNRLTDTYNAISVLHQVPLGGVEVKEHPVSGEVIWRDEAGVTCRRWNWRQGRRTQLSDGTTNVLFILDALAPVTDEKLQTATDDLATHLARLGPGVTIKSRIPARPTSN